MLTELEDNNYFTIKSLSEQDYYDLTSEFLVLDDGHNFPRSYYLIKTANFCFLANQTDIGLGEPLCRHIEEKHILIISLPFRSYIIDSETNKMIKQIELCSPCITLLFDGKKVLFICETEVVEHHLDSNESLISRDFKSLAVDVFKISDSCFCVVLDDGAQHLLT